LKLIKNKFPKSERLTNERIITELFKKAHVEFLYPFRVMILYKDDFNESFPKVLFSVPKKNFKKAVDRNLIRRRAKEIYRVNKNIFLTSYLQKKIPSYLGIIYIAKEKVPYQVMEIKLISILDRLTK